MAVNSRASRDSGQLAFQKFLLTLIFGTVGIAFLAALAARATTRSTTLNPLDMVLGLIDGSQPWTQRTTVLLVALVAAALAVIVALWWLLRPRKNAMQRFQTAAAVMVKPKQLQHITRKAARKSGEKLAPELKGSPAVPGIKLGTTMAGNAPVFLDWESTMLVVAGPRMGKTQAIALPAIATAPGAVIATSNKSDIYAETWEYRNTVGTVWVFDPQNVAGKTNMWWNPLGRVTDLPSALKLTGWLSSGAGNTAGANQGNKYFQDEGEKLLASMILAAACGDGDLKHVAEWLSDIQSDVPVSLLQDKGFTDPARDVLAIQTMEPRQRDGVLGFARQPVSVLSHAGFAQYVTPPTRKRFSSEPGSGLTMVNYEPGLHDSTLTEFEPAAFARSHDTLYSLSLEGIGSAAGLVTALTGEVLEEAVNVANAQGGRLPVPLVAVLDEAANVVRLSELPKQVSHFGSRGVIPITILQSPAQARSVWGDDGWEALKSSSAVRYYGGNVDDDKYLGELSSKIGDHGVTYTSQSGSGRSSSVQRERILEVSELAALPKELAVVQSPGNEPVLIEKDFLFNNKQLKDKMANAKSREVTTV